MEKVRIWLDDVRPMPEGFDVWCKTTHELLPYVINNNIGYLSLDNDMGNNSEEGIWIANLIEELAYLNKIELFEWDIHSANPPGRKNIEAAMRSAERYWKLAGKLG